MSKHDDRLEFYVLAILHRGDEKQRRVYPISVRLPLQTGTDLPGVLARGEELAVAAAYADNRKRLDEGWDLLSLDLWRKDGGEADTLLHSVMPAFDDRCAAGQPIPTLGSDEVYDPAPLLRI